MLIIIIRSVLLYILIVFALRLMGKKQLAQLQPSNTYIQYCNTVARGFNSTDDIRRYTDTDDSLS